MSSLQGVYINLVRLLVVLSLFFSSVAFTQGTLGVESGMDVFGQFGYSTTGKTSFITFGGPAIKIKYDNKGLGLSFFPSFRMTELPGGNIAQPQLGFGLFFEMDKFSIIMPTYALKEEGDSQTKLKFTFGLGYKFK